MDLNSSRFGHLSPLKQALLAIEDMQARFAEAERVRTEPIAIVGMGCRFPKAGNPEEFWKILAGGVDAVTEVPASRWRIEEYYHPDPISLERCQLGGADFSIRWISSIRSSSGSRRVRLSSWIRNSVCCSKSRGRRSRMPGKDRTISSIAGPACSSASPAMNTPNASFVPVTLPRLMLISPRALRAASPEGEFLHAWCARAEHVD